MKKCILLLSLTAFVFAGEKTTNFKVKGMSCKFGCSTKVKTALEGVDGVKLCDVNFETSTTTVTYNDEEILDKDIMKILSEKTDFEILIENKPKEETSPFKKFLSKFFKS
jgi:copper chaperone CopZ